MGAIRNNIIIEGIYSEKDLPEIVNGKSEICSSTEILFLPQNKPEINDIHGINIKLTKKSKRTVHTPHENIIIIDFIKTFRILYTDTTKSNLINTVYIHSPCNTFFSIPKDMNYILDSDIYLLNALFSVVDKRKIQSKFIYLVHACFDTVYHI